MKERPAPYDWEKRDALEGLASLYGGQRPGPDPGFWRGLVVGTVLGAGCWLAGFVIVNALLGG